MEDWGCLTRIGAVIGLLFTWMIVGQLIFPSKEIPGSVAPELDGRWIAGAFVIVIGGFVWALFGWSRGAGGSSYEPTYDRHGRLSSDPNYGKPGPDSNPDLKSWN